MSFSTVAGLRKYRANWAKRIKRSVLLRDWPECQSILLDESDSATWAIKLVVGSCLAVGGEAEAASPVAAAWSSLNVAAHVLDQAQDTDVSSRPKAENLSVGLIFVAYEFLADVNPSYVNQVMRIFSESGFASVIGQDKGFALDNGASPAKTLELYWETVLLKSGSLIKMATSSGAAVATRNEKLINALAGYGEALGVILQILDDCRDVLDEQLRYEVSLPILLYSLAIGNEVVTYPQAQSREELVKILEESGTLLAISNVLFQWQQQCLENLAILPSSDAVDALKVIVTDTLNQGLTQRGK